MTMTKRRILRGLATAAVSAGLVLGLAACGGDDDSGDAGTTADAGGGEVQKGGTYRVAQTDFGFTDAFDPTGEYLGAAWGLYSNLFHRTLLTYKHLPDAAGNEVVGDLAELPEISEDGLTYTFTLKDGVMFAPPLNRPITSRDIAFAFERIATPALAAGYGFYYDQIEGIDAFREGDAETIAGITTPDERTIVFTLTQPVGDFINRVAMPATGPIPEEVGSCYTQAGQYGRYVIASGPYMIEGSDQLDVTSCATQQPISGFNPNRFLRFVRNPNYDPATDSPEVRESNPDRFEFTINTNLDDVFARIESGDLDDSPDAPPPDVIRRFSQDEALQERLKINGGDRTWYLAMNLTQAPFDDVNVRKALNFVLDKEGIQRAWGGPLQGEIATKTVPDSLYGGALTNEDYNPYPSENNAGDVEAAKEAMRASPYDTDKDGVCDAPACKGVFFVNRNFGAWAAMQPIIEQSLESIGITLESRELPLGPAYTTTQTVGNEVALMANHGWAKDYADPSTFAVLHDGRTIIATNNTNISLTGITQEQASELGVPFPEGGVPNVDADIDRCLALIGEERATCYVDFDKKLMEEIVPWVPYLDATNIGLISARVSEWEFDQFSGEAAYSKVAVPAE